MRVNLIKKGLNNGNNYSVDIRIYWFKLQITVQSYFINTHNLCYVAYPFNYYAYCLEKTEEVQTRYRWQKTSAYIATLIVILLVGRVWFEGVQALATYFGLLSAGVAIALKDLVSSLAGWAFIIWRSPLAVGDRIQIGE